MARMFVLALLFFSTASFAQVREVPTLVKDAFTAQYPSAENIKYDDNLVSVQVHFTIDGENMLASYTNKGRWKETEKDWSYDRLPEEVKTGFTKSKYADWKVTTVKIITRPGNVERYRIKVEKNDLQKKHLFFNKAGRLTEDAITL